MKWNNENSDARVSGKKWLSALINWLNWWRIQFFKPLRNKSSFYSALNEVTSRFAELAMNLFLVCLWNGRIYIKDNLSGRGTDMGKVLTPRTL